MRYYQGSFSQPLLDAIGRDANTVWDEQYYNDIYANAALYFEESNANFQLAGKRNERGDALQLVMLIMALGLAFAAWASLLGEQSNMRLVFAVFAVLTLVAGLIAYLNVPSAA